MTCSAYDAAFPLGNYIASSVVTVAGICNSVSGGVFLTCHRGAGAKYRSMSRLGLLGEIGGCRGFEIVPAVLECNNSSLHATVGVH